MIYRSIANEIYFVPNENESALVLRVGYLISDGTFESFLDKKRDFSILLNKKERSNLIRFDPNRLDDQSKKLVIKFAFDDYAPWRIG